MIDFLRLLGLSFIIHIFLFLSLIGLSVLVPPSKPLSPETVEVEILPSEPSRRAPPEQAQQIVQQADAPEAKPQPNDREARFLSEKTQRVEKESQAALSGLTKNRQSSSKSVDLSQLTKTSRELQRTKPEAPKIKGEGPGEEVSAEKEMERFAQQTDRLQERNPRNTQDSPSTTSDALPTDVAVGSITALNTDRLTYYSFYSRVNEAIYFRWNSRVRTSLDSFDSNYIRNVIRLNRWVTQAEILLRPDGRVHKVLIMKESGILRFDLAAVNAFKEAAIFPNPPQEMIQDDGFIHLKYSFTVAIN